MRAKYKYTIYPEGLPSETTTSRTAAIKRAKALSTEPDLYNNVVSVMKKAELTDSSQVGYARRGEWYPS